NVDLEPDELRCDFGEALRVSLRPAILDRNVATLEPPEFAQSIYESGGPLALDCRRARAKVPDGRQLTRLLRARRQRPRRRCADKRDELAPLHSITSSARPSNGRGIVRPSAFAIFRLTAISIFVACSTGRSAAFSPLRMRPELKPTLRYAPAISLSVAHETARRNELAVPIDGWDSVLSRQFDQPITLAQEEILAAYHECAKPLSDNGRESRLDLAGGTCFQNHHTRTEGTCRILYDGSFSCRLPNVSRVEENGDRG